MFWYGQVVTRGLGARGELMALVKQATTHIGKAQTALAENDFERGEQEFLLAATVLQQARADLGEALAVSEETLTLLDVGGLIGGYDKLLAAAAQVGEAGQLLSHGLGLLQVAPAAVNDGDGNWSLVDILRGVQADFQAADESLAQAQAALAEVHIGLMPSSLRGPAKQLNELVPLARLGINQYLSRAELLLTMAGANHERDYLLVFQNNHELRPTGGFIGSLALVNVDRGVVENIDVQSVYDSDGQLKEFIDPPRPLQNITNRWYLRDANWFVDWRQSARKITHFFEKEGGPTVDGVIALTPAVIERLLTVSGPLQVPGYDDQITAENFFTVAQEQVTYSYDREENRPKQFFADLTPVLLNKLFSGGYGRSSFSLGPR